MTVRNSPKVDLELVFSPSPNTFFVLNFQVLFNFPIFVVSEAEEFGGKGNVLINGFNVFFCISAPRDQMRNHAFQMERKFRDDFRLWQQQAQIKVFDDPRKGQDSRIAVSPYN